MLEGKKVLTIVSKDYDDLEFFYPMIRLREEKATVLVAAEKAKTDYVGKYGLTIKSDLSFDDVNISEFDALLIPGGWAPDYLRRIPKVIDFVKYMNKEKRVIGIICHAGWVLASADILEGVNVTSTPGIKDDLTNAKAIWHNIEAIKDGHIISARRPPDLIYYLPLIIEVLCKGQILTL
ncbi:type 1 glutamine amidotransferase domain-containing protein [Mariniplasma anaerobium]|uniref:Protease n=1 Tax=Mariniplasma anaerobium TaxID=2735436 RepID=A0A7U9XVM9_9MOLU|nr:type 1 glutamine amidotransferase domain-containing protein [Mariniplasma anaerobium]BCR35572.1 protease [Mariniplasma anaerobium]